MRRKIAAPQLVTLKERSPLPRMKGLNRRAHFSPGRHFYLFVENEALPPFDAWVALAWRLGGPWAAQTQTQSQSQSAEGRNLPDLADC